MPGIVLARKLAEPRNCGEPRFLPKAHRRFINKSENLPDLPVRVVNKPNIHRQNHYERSAHPPGSLFEADPSPDRVPQELPRTHSAL
jgi:hypothetical protein